MLCVICGVECNETPRAVTNIERKYSDVASVTSALAVVSDFVSSRLEVSVSTNPS